MRRFIDDLLWIAVTLFGLYLFGTEHDMHNMLFGLGVMLFGALGATLSEMFRTLAPVFLALDGRFDAVDRKLDGLADELRSIERRLP